MRPIGDWSTSSTSCSSSQPVSARTSPTCFAQVRLGRVSAVQPRLEVPVDARRGAACSCRSPRRPVTAVSVPSGMSRRTPCRLCSRRAAHLEPPSDRPRRRRLGTAIRFSPGEILPGERLRRGPATGPACTTRPPCSPAPGPSSSMKSACRMAARSCSTTTHGVAAVAQPAEQREQAVGVARVQPDRGLVQHVERVHQPRRRARWRARSAAPRRRRACASAGRASGSRARRRAGSSSRAVELRPGPDARPRARTP